MNRPPLPLTCQLFCTLSCLPLRRRPLPALAAVTSEFRVARNESLYPAEGGGTIAPPQPPHPNQIKRGLRGRCRFLAASRAPPADSAAQFARRRLIATRNQMLSFTRRQVRGR